MEESLDGKVEEVEFSKLNDFVASLNKQMITQRDELDKKTKQVEREMYAKNSELINQIADMEALVKDLQHEIGRCSSSKSLKSKRSSSGS